MMNREFWDSELGLGQFWDNFAKKASTRTGELRETAVKLRISRVGA